MTTSETSVATAPQCPVVRTRNLAYDVFGILYGELAASWRDPDGRIAQQARIAEMQRDLRLSAFRVSLK